MAVAIFVFVCCVSLPCSCLPFPSKCSWRRASTSTAWQPCPQLSGSPRVNSGVMVGVHGYLCVGVCVCVTRWCVDIRECVGEGSRGALMCVQTRTILTPPPPPSLFPRVCVSQCERLCLCVSEAGRTRFVPPPPHRRVCLIFSIPHSPSPPKKGKLQLNARWHTSTHTRRGRGGHTSHALDMRQVSARPPPAPAQPGKGGGVASA